MEEAISKAARLVQEAHDIGRLLTPAEAMALAGREARNSETLYSIARRIGWQAHLDVDEIHSALVEMYPRYR
jgi:Tfp pilus assembly protein FimV